MEDISKLYNQEKKIEMIIQTFQEYGSKIPHPDVRSYPHKSRTN